MDCPWRRTFASVFLVLSLHNVRVLSQNVVPTGPLPPLPLVREPLRDGPGASLGFIPQQMNLPPGPPNGIPQEFVPLIPCPPDYQQLRSPIFQDGARPPVAAELSPILLNSIPQANDGTNIVSTYNELQNANALTPQRPLLSNPLLASLPPPRLNIIPSSFGSISQNQNLNVQSISSLPSPTGPPPNFPLAPLIPIQPCAACDIPPNNFPPIQTLPSNVPIVPLAPIPQDPLYFQSPIPLVPYSLGPTFNIPPEDILPQVPLPNFSPMPLIPIQQSLPYSIQYQQNNIPITEGPLYNVPVPLVPVSPYSEPYNILPNNVPINQVPLPNLPLLPLVPFPQDLPSNIPLNNIPVTQVPQTILPPASLPVSQVPQPNLPLIPLVPFPQGLPPNMPLNNIPVTQIPQTILPPPLLSVSRDQTFEILPNNVPILQMPSSVSPIPFPQGPLLNIPPNNVPISQGPPFNISPDPLIPFLQGPLYNIPPNNVLASQVPPLNIPPAPLVPIQTGPPITYLPPIQPPLTFPPTSTISTNPYNIPLLQTPAVQTPQNSLINSPQVPIIPNLVEPSLNFASNPVLQNQNMQGFPLITYPQPYLPPSNVQTPCTLTTDLTSIQFLQPPILPPVPPVQMNPFNAPTLTQPPLFPQSITSVDCSPTTDIQISALPPALPRLNVQQTCGNPTNNLKSLEEGFSNAPISLQINVPPPIMPEPQITIITAFPSPPELPVATTDNSEFSLGMYPPYPMPPVIIEGSKRSRSWLPLFLVALFSRDGYYEGGDNCCCSPCNDNDAIPIPYPIPIPTNNPIILGPQ